MKTANKLFYFLTVGLAAFLVFTAIGFWFLSMRTSVSTLSKLFISTMSLSGVWFLVAAWKWGAFVVYNQSFSWKGFLEVRPTNEDALYAWKWGRRAALAWIICAISLAGIVASEFIFR